MAVQSYISTGYSTGNLAKIFKSGMHTDPFNYRFISLLCCLAKIYASILLRRIEQFITVAQLMRPEKIGFRQGYSTAHHAQTLYTLIQQSINNGCTHHVAFIDFKKAFDMVPRRLL